MSSTLRSTGKVFFYTNGAQLNVQLTFKPNKAQKKSFLTYCTMISKELTHCAKKGTRIGLMFIARFQALYSEGSGLGESKEMVRTRVRGMGCWKG